MKRIKNIGLALMMGWFSSCAEQAMEGVDVEEKRPILLSASYPVMTSSRATDNGFVADDEVGVFIVDYDAEGNAGEPALKGNRGSNVRFTYDGAKWSAPYQLYWADGKTPADFYGYYPFDETMVSVTDYAFSIKKQQSGDETTTSASGYEQSDLLWAKTEKVMPTDASVNLSYRHLMAGITVMLEKGTGFTDAEWNEWDKTVQVENTILSGHVNLKTGAATVGNDQPEAITPLGYNGKWRAVTYPQTVEAGKSLVSVTVDGQSYQLMKTEAMTYQSGKMHNFTVTVNKKSAGTLEFQVKGMDMVAWIDDADLHEGLVRQYTIIEVDEPGTLQQTLAEAGLDYERVVSLKVKGEINADDMNFMGQQMMALTNVNLQHATITDGIVGGFNNHTRLTHFVFPQSGVTKIAESAFARTSLTGSLVIPEGVVVIDRWAYSECGLLVGTLTLPSTLKRIELGAFSDTKLSGELRLPEGIEYIDAHEGNLSHGHAVFLGCDFSGNLHLPESLTSLPNLGFPKVTGTVTIPRNITVIEENLFDAGGGYGAGISQVEFHDGITEIRGGAFVNTQLSGELVLPPNLKKLGGKPFLNTKITNVIFPDALQIMLDGNYDSEGTFADCNRLTGTIHFAKNVARVPKGCFINCSAMTGIILPKNVEIVDDRAFENCYSLNTIVCENPEPPIVGKNAFHGVPKDNFTLEVPKGSVEKYKNADGWKEFKRIAEYSNFVCRPAQANALNSAHSETLILNADGAWEVQHCPDWCTLSATSGNGKTELRLTFNQMTSGSENRRDSILFRMQDAGHTTYCVVSQYDYVHQEDSYTTLQNHTKGDGIDILFIGDGYDGEDISNGKYLSTVNQQMEYFFGIEPYKSHREYFDVHVAFPLSQEKGVNTMNTYVNNRFGTLYGYDGTICTKNQLITEITDVYDYVLAHSPLKAEKMHESLVILVPNSGDYSGVTYYADKNLTLSICPPSERSYPQDMRGVIQHEAGGHGFGRLGDEEIIYTKWAPQSTIYDIEVKHSWGWYQNLATTSKMNEVPWAEFIFDTRYSDEVDIYEGGAGYMRGVFRPESNSCMNYGIPYYNVASRLSIMQRILSCAGEWFNMDYFYANDSKAWGETGSRSVWSEGSSYGKSSLHKVPAFIDMQQMGKAVNDIREKTKSKRIY